MIAQVLKTTRQALKPPVWQRRGERVEWLPARLTEAFCLFLICTLAFLVRFFAVIRYESVIHEFDPYFNFRTTKYLVSEGIETLWNWFDLRSWYPLGRVVGQTLYPGLMTTAAAVQHLLRFAAFHVDIRETCVFLAPVFSSLTALTVYLLTKEATSRADAGLLGALFVSLSPAYLSRSVAGSYDNEAVAIFALAFTFYWILRSLRTRSLLTAAVAAAAYFYMVSSWGGYVFVLNVVVVFFFVRLVTTEYAPGYYVVYSVFYVLGTLVCLNIPFVNFQAVTSAEHLPSHLLFLGLQALVAADTLRRCLPIARLRRLSAWLLGCAVAALVLAFLLLSLLGKTKWAGRSLTLLDPTYASRFIPIIASVSEHQPPIWSSFVFDLDFTFFLFPLGLWIALRRSASDSLFFLGVYGALSVYFSCVMVRLVLVLSPVAASLAAIGLSQLMQGFSFHAADTFARNILESEAMKAPPRHLEKQYALKRLGLDSLGFSLRTYSLVRRSLGLDLEVIADNPKQLQWTAAGLLRQIPFSYVKNQQMVEMLRRSNVEFTAACLKIEAPNGSKGRSLAPAGKKKASQREKAGNVAANTNHSGNNNSSSSAGGVLARLLEMEVERGSDLETLHRWDEAHKCVPGPQRSILSVKVVGGLLALLLLSVYCYQYVLHGVMGSALAYSHPSIVMHMRFTDGTACVQDDFREAYYWMRKNTPYDARIMSWWDYGYQSCHMSDRTVIVDNNTWNNTHIATVGLAFASPEDEAYEIVQRLDVDYVFVVFGGKAKYSGDDLNKFLWMIRIAGGVYPWIKEKDYYSYRGYALDDSAPIALRRSLMYRLSYHNFHGPDRLRGAQVNIESLPLSEGGGPLRHFEEVYTTTNWIVRIYKVKPPANRNYRY